jgi:MYXO-CTERM domain-containing protein
MSASASDCAAIALCDGVSSCAASTVVCAPYTCLDDTKCRTSCGTDQDCTAEYRCDDGACVLRQPGCAGSVAITADGDEIDCAPYLCQADGSCRSSCSSAAECVEPFVCDPDGRCVSLGASGDEGDDGCGCRMPGGGGAAGGAAWLVVALAAMRARRWRRVAGAGGS